jgi:cytochrome c oxidase subunit 4
MATQPAEFEERHDEGDHGPARTTYVAVFGGLLALTLLTAGAAYAPMPEWLHTPVALAIAAAKASLVLLFFMHLLYSPRLIWLVACGSLVWVLIMLALTWADYLTRPWMVR